MSTSAASRPAASTTPALSSARSSPVERVGAERVTGGEDRGERRAQIVRHGSQQRRLDVVAAAQRGGLDRLRLHGVAVKRDRDQRAERPDHVLAQPLDRLGRKVTSATSSVATCSPSGPRRAIASRRGSGGTAPSSIAAEGSVIASARRRAVDPSTSLGLRPGQQLPRQSGGEVGLLAAALGFGGAAASEVGDRAHHHGDRDERRQRDPVARVGDREPADRRDVEEVERGCARQRRRQPQRESPVGRHEQHRRQVDDAQRDRRRHRLQRVDRGRGDGNRQCRKRDAQPHWRTFAAKCAQLRAVGH